ncbi:MAG TPA: TIGR01777 family oxidoreductase [Thermoanaerobaculia bacterium]
MDIVVAGGSGLLGEPLVRRLIARGDDVAVLSRDPRKVRAGRGVQWDGKSAGAWTGEIDAADAVINLAGENIGAGRWTEERKRRLIDSRLDATSSIVAALSKASRRNRVLINASAVGFYGFERDEIADESAPKGRGFLADLVDRWESAAKRAEPFARVVILRFGVVLAQDGGALAKMMLPFRFGAGGPVGSGRQWMSWVDRDDVLRAIEWALTRGSVRGAYNITAPEPVTNKEFARTLGRVMHRPSLLPAPGFALRLVFGEMADEALLGGQRAVPRRTEAEGFRFEHAKLESALRHVTTP